MRTTISQNEREDSPWYDGWLCGAVVLLCFLATGPYVEMGLVDDFSYVKTAWVFARTGHLVYNGWATAMLGWQIPFAALFIKLLGSTFFAARVSITVLLVLTVVLAQAVMRRCGLNRVHAAFGALLVGLSPLTLPVAATFMTDIAGLLVIVVCLYCAVRAVAAETDRQVLIWLALGFAAGAVGSTARQIAWMAPLVLMPSAAWLRRRQKGVVALAVVLWLLSAAFMLACLHWFNRQPFHVPEPLKQGPLDLRTPRELTGTMLAAALCLVLLLLPVMFGAWPSVARLKSKVLGLLLAASVSVTLVFRFVAGHIDEHGWLPWTGDLVGRMDIFDTPNLWLPGATPITWNLQARIVGSFVTVAVMVLFWWIVRKRPQGSEAGTMGISWPALKILLLPFCLAYVLLLCPRGIWAMVLDRYLLPLLVLGALVLLRLLQERVSARLSAAAWVALAVWTAWGMAGLHDWIEIHRARLAAVERLQSAGVPKSEVSAGFEYDGLTQIELAGAVADPRVKLPAGFKTEVTYPDGLPQGCRKLFLTRTPALEPRYFLTWDAEPCLAPSQFGDVRFRRWLPPFEATIHIDKLQN